MKTRRAMQFVVAAAMSLLVAAVFPSISLSAEIHRAAREGDLAQVQQLVAADAKTVNAKDENGNTPLSLAVQRNRIEVVTHLLDNGADPNAIDASGNTAMMCAAQRGRQEIAALLCDRGVDVKATTASGQTALHTAAFNRKTQVAALLVDRGADVNAVDHVGATPLHWACWHPRQEMIDLLLSRGANVKATDRDGSQPLHNLAREGHTDAINWLLQKGADADCADATGATPLHLAVRAGHADAVQALLVAAKNLNQKETHYGQTALHWAAIYGKPQVASILLQHGADPSIKDASARTALDCARRYGHVDVVAAMSGEQASPVPVAMPDVAAGQAQVWYCGQSAWVVKTANHLLVFDYAKEGMMPPSHPSLANGFLTSAALQGLDVTVFVSHEHSDHFDPAIFAWSDAAKMQYVYGFKPNQRYAGPAYSFVGPREQKDIGEMKVAGIESLDTDGGFLVRVDGLAIFHAGDHANLNTDTRAAYDNEINYIASLTDHVDLAMLPVSGCPGSWKREHVIEGFFSAISALHAKTVLPMHAMQREWEYRNFAELAKTRAPGATVLCAQFPGDDFRVSTNSAAK